MRTPLKPFQEATVEAVLAAFSTDAKTRRFLVADEVGLGKTLVAQEVIRRMVKRRRGRKPFIVFYVCSNLSIARQNRRKLLEILPPDERGQALCNVDRLTLMHIAQQPRHKRLHLYAFTPGTSIPSRPGSGQHRSGRKEERALIQVLVEALWPRFLERVGADFFRVNVRTEGSWKRAVDRQRVHAQNRHLLNVFEKSVRIEFKVKKGHRTETALVRFARRRNNKLNTIRHLRNALAAGAILEVQPDLVIFDEFQRFRDLISAHLDDSAARVISRLRGDPVDASRGPALLMLSATPYRLYSSRWEDEGDNSHHSEFFELVQFLYGNDQAGEGKRRECEAEFRVLAQELRKGQALTPVALQARETVQDILKPIMARTERASDTNRLVDCVPAEIQASLEASDLEVFAHLSDSFALRHRSMSVVFWNSIPLPMQMMGPRYTVWKQADSVGADDVPGLTEAQRNMYDHIGEWPHPRLRAISQEILDIDQLSLPWLAPSLPWWPLKGGWKDNDFSKVLIFSRFRAVPQAIASLISYETEAHLFAQGTLDYPQVTRRRILNPTPKRHALLALFCPSPWFVENTDPLRGGRASLSATRRRVRKQVLRALRKVGISCKRTAQGKRPVWQLLAQIEQKAGNWQYVHDAWWEIHLEVGKGSREGAGLAGLLTDWTAKASEPIDCVTSAEVDELAEYALSSPGVVVGRALKRLWPGAVSLEDRDGKGFVTTLDAAWNGLRNYLDQRWFVASLRKRGSYPNALMKAVVDGNLEAVLDEYLWISRTVAGVEGPALAGALKDALRLRSGIHRLYTLGQKEETFSLRCHVAIPFTDPQKLVIGDNETPLRQDEIRKSFNAPFWPYVLATTSVGQEGLDFHVWCDRLVHWDISRNPVDWEQREGRIQRYGGLAIRRAIALQLGSQLWDHLKSGQSPWEQLATLADKELADESGLRPWWVCPGADIKHYVFDVPLSEQKHQLQWVHRQRMLYRMVLGQPHQEDLVSFIDERTEIEPERLREAMLQLSPWFGDHDST